MSDLAYLPEHLQEVINGLSDGQLNKLKRTLAVKLRREQSKRITAQQNVDGSSYTPRRPQKTRKGQKTKRVRAKMMNTIKQAKHMRIEQDGQGVKIGYTGRMAAIASVHQHGLTSRISPNNPNTASYPVRELLGISDDNKQMIDELVLDYIESILG